LKKAKFVKFGVKKANLATMLSRFAFLPKQSLRTNDAVMPGYFAKTSKKI